MTQDPEKQFVCEDCWPKIEKIFDIAEANKHHFDTGHHLREAGK